jgi:hypothetical protein
MAFIDFLFFGFVFDSDLQHGAPGCYTRNPMSTMEAFEIRKTLGEMKAKLDFLRGSL